MRRESQIASPSMTSSGTARWPLACGDLVAVAPAPGDADLLVLDPLAAQLARDAPAGAQAVGRRAAAVERRLAHDPSEATRPPARRDAEAGHRAAPAAGGRPGCPTIPGSRSRYQAIVSTSVSSWCEGFQPRSRLAFVERKAHQSEPALTSATVISGLPGQALGGGGELQRDGQRQLDRRRLDAAQAREVGEQAVEREVAVAEDVALARARRARRRAGARRATSVRVDDVQRAVDVGRDLAAQEAPHEHRRGAIDVAAPEHVGGVDDHDRQAVRGDPQRLVLGRVLAVDVRQAVVRRRGRPGARRRSRRAAAGPIAATDEVCTTRSTPARSASSSTIRVPSTLTR